MISPVLTEPRLPGRTRTGLPGLDPGSILLFFLPKEKWIPGQARNYAGY